MRSPAILVFPFILAACSLAPEHHADAGAAAAAWPEEVVDLTTHEARKVSPGETAAEADKADKAVLPPLTENSWRNFFVDPALQKVIAAALESNRDLAAAVGRVAEARAQAGMAEADRWPAIDLVAQRNATHTPVGVKGNGAAGTTVRRSDVNLAMAYELDFWGRVASLDAAARANYLASDFARQSFRLSLIGDVAAAWYALEDSQQREHLLTKALAARKETLDITRQRGEVGLASDLELRMAEAGYHTSASELAAGRRSRMTAESALRLLLGRDIDPAWRPGIITDGAMLPLPQLPLSVIGLPSTAILRRPDVQAAEQKLIAARANIGAARAAFLPKIMLTAAAGTASSALNGLFIAGSDAWSFTPSLRLPLFDAGRNADALDLAKAREHIAVADYERTVQQAFRDIVDSLAIARYGNTAVAESYRSAEAQLARYELIKARHAAGVVNTLELLDAEREALAMQQQQVTMRRNANTNSTIFFKSLGGV